MSTTLLSHVAGRLHLSFCYDRAYQRTRLLTCEQEPPLRIVRTFPLAQGGTLLHLHNLSGGVLGGDRLTVEIDVGPEARVQLTTTGATRVYRSRPGIETAQQRCAVRIEAGGLLEYLPDELIPFADSRYQQVTRIEMEHDAGLFWWETIAPGRLAHGESFAYESLQIESEILAAGQPIACERYKLEPRHASLPSPARLGAYRYHTSFFICRVGLPAARWQSLEQDLTALALQLTRPGEIAWGVSALVAHGLLVRAVSQRGYTIPPGLLAFWRKAKQALYGENALPPRKMY